MKKFTQHISYGKVGIAVCALVAASSSFAVTNIPEKVEQLKMNAEASKENLKQYEGNLKVVNDNLKETQVAVKQLDKQKAAVTRQLEDAKKGKVSVENSKKQLQGFLKAEQDKADVEKKQIEDLKNTLATLEANQTKRAENIAAYRVKIQGIEADQGNWQGHQDEIVQLDKAIKEKQTQALNDQKALIAKKASYEQEIKKWEKQKRVSERTYANFKDLKDE